MEFPALPFEGQIYTNGNRRWRWNGVGWESVTFIEYAPISHVGSGGNAHAIATTEIAGFMAAADKIKLNGIAAGATVGAAWGANLTGIPTNIVSWAGIAPSTKANTSTTVTLDNQQNITGNKRFISGVDGATSATSALEVFQNSSTGDAYMTFHISGQYATHIGLDGATNDLFVGGWSSGTVKHRIWHAGNFTPAAKANLSGAAFTGSISAPAITSSQNFSSSGVNAVLSASGGGLYLRPVSDSSDESQVVIGANGSTTLFGQTGNISSPRLTFQPKSANSIPGLTFQDNAMAFRGGIYWNPPTNSLDFFTSQDGTNPRMRLHPDGRLETVSGFHAGSNVAASAADLSRHLNLYGGTYGLSITSNTLNVVANGVAVALFTSSGFTAAEVRDNFGNVRKMPFATVNSSVNITSANANQVVEKSSDGAFTYTIPLGTGSQGDAITFVNSGAAGNLIIQQAAGVTLWRNGVAGNITIPPGGIVTIYRSATANRWIY